MNHPIKIEQSKIIRYIYSSIKKDNLKIFQELTKDNDWIFDFKNNKRENILFYAFENNSINIIEYILSKKPELIKEKNILNLNIIHELIIKNKNIDYFVKKMIYWDLSSIEKIYNNKDPQGNNIILMAAKSGNIDYLNNIIKNCPNFKEIQEHSNSYGQNMAHFISTNIIDDYNKFEFIINKNLLSKIDNINGLSPLMLAAYHQKEKNFKYLFEINEIEQESILGNNLLHFSAHNNDQNVTKILIEKGFFNSNKNRFDQTPFFISLLKSYDKVSEVIFKEVKKTKINQEEFILTPKISIKNPELFREIIEKTKKENISKENQQKFLEYLFLFSNEQTIKYIKGIKEYSEYFNDLDFSSLFSKIITGKKEMALKTNFLLENKSLLTENEVISVYKSMMKLPTSQIIFLFKNSNLLKKTSKEHKSLFLALSLSKGINFPNENEIIEYNDSDNIQKEIKDALKGSKIESSPKHIQNIENWLNIFKDKKIVLKHYGNIIAKHQHPFHYLDNSFKLLGKENKKELVYYTITSLFKKDIEISPESIMLITKHPNLISSVYAGIIKFGKIPCNNNLLEILEKTKHTFLDSEDLNYFLSRSSKKSKEAIQLINKTLNIFNLTQINDLENFCDSLVKHEEHYSILAKISDKIENKDDFILSYIKSYIKNPINKTDENLIEKLISNHKFSETITKYFFEMIIKNDKFNNKELIKKISKNINLKDYKEFNQNLIDNGEYIACNKISKLITNKSSFSIVDFSKTNWLKIDSQPTTICDNNFFNFVYENRNKFSEKQINILAKKLTQETKNNMSITTIDNFLTALDVNINKIEDEILLSLTSYMLDKYFNDDAMIKYLSETNFNHVFNIITENKKGSFFKEIQSHENYSLIPKESRIKINKEIMNEEIQNKEQQKPIKKFKI